MQVDTFQSWIRVLQGDRLETLVRCPRRLCDPGNPVVSQWRTWRTCHFSPNPGAASPSRMCLVRLVTSVLKIVTTLIVMGRTSKAVNSAKNIAAIRDQIVKDMGMDHIPDVKHVSIFKSLGNIVANFLVL